MRIGILYNYVDQVERGFAEDAISDNEVVQTVELVRRALEPEHEAVPVRVSEDLLRSLRRESFDLVFNLCEGYGGKPQGESWVAAWLDLLGIPYTGSGPLTLGLCLDKGRTKHVLASCGVPTPRYRVFESADPGLRGDLSYPLFVKPVREDASIGISEASIVRDDEALRRRVSFVLEHYAQPALVEEFIEGRELNVAVVGSGAAAEALPVSEIVFDLPPGAPRIVCYDAKWKEDTSAYRGTTGVCPAALTAAEAEAVRTTALAAYRLMGCADYGRVDFRLRDGVPWVLEVNPNPGINADSGFARSSRAAGRDYPAMIRAIVAAAIARRGPSTSCLPQADILAREGRLLGLRPRPAHIPLLLAWFNDPEVSRYMEAPERKTGHDDLVQALLVERADTDLVLAEESGRPLGFASLYGLREDNRSAEISFLLGERDARGRGLGTAAVRMLLGIAFGAKALDTVTATVTERNIPSLKAMQRAGFREAGRLRGFHVLAGEAMDEILLQIRREDWRV